MKKYAIVAIVILVVLGIAWAQDTGQTRRGAGGANMSEEQRNAMRERFANMSEEERAAFRERMRAGGGGFGGGFGRGMRLSQEDQLAAIKVIQEQAAKLKASIEGTDRPDFAAMRDMPQEERTKAMEKIRQAFTERNEIITVLQEKITALSMRPPAPTVTREDIQEMGEIQKLATEEKATKTAERLQTLMAKFRQAGGGRGGMMGQPRQPGQPGEAGAPARRTGRTRGGDQGTN